MVTLELLTDYFQRKSLQHKQEDLQSSLHAHLAKASVLLPLIQSNNDLEVLFTVRTAHVRHHANQISFPGGGMERNDSSLEETCVRETYEEIGIPPKQIQLLGNLKPVISSSGFLVVPFVGLLQNPIHISPNPLEVADTFTAPLSFLLDYKNHQKQSYNYNSTSKLVYVIEYKQYQIWGLTAKIIVDLTKELFATDHG